MSGDRDAWRDFWEAYNREFWRMRRYDVHIYIGIALLAIFFVAIGAVVLTGLVGAGQ